MTILYDIQKMGFALPEDILNDIEAVSYILTNQIIVNLQLIKLERLISENAAIKDINLKTIFDGTYSGSPEDSRYNCFKLISDSLYYWSQKNGYNNLVGKLNNFLTQKQFLDLLKQKILLKDVGAGPEHGEFTHAIQWFIITEANKDLNLLSMPAAELYARIGENDCVGKRSYFSMMLQSPINTMTTIWDLLVDRLYAEQKFDFRNPEFAREHIVATASLFPCLSQLHQIRYAKRTTEKLQTMFFSLDGIKPEQNEDPIMLKAPDNNRIYKFKSAP